MSLHKNLPHKPGCYLYKDKRDNIIYVGKAKDLKKRVASYFTKNDHDIKTEQLVSNIDSVDFFVTDTEVEALVLENNLIKEHTPKYNIDLKDSKRYAYIKVTNEDFPKLLIARKTNNKDKFFGPFTSGKERDYLLQFFKKAFKLRTCKRLPKKECLRYHINLCDAPCIKNISKTTYNERIRQIGLILKGRTKDVIDKLKTDMQEESDNLNFEKAMEIKNLLGSLEYLNEKQKLERNKKYDEDIINYIVDNNKVYLLMFNVHRGTLLNKSEFTFDYRDGFLDEFITQYYSDNPIPKELIVPKKVDPAIEELLSKKGKKIVNITIPKIGEKKKLLNLITKNIELSFFNNAKKIEELELSLNLPEPPTTIECFDISHLSGTSTVASMVRFTDAKPDKKNYRRFKIRTVDGINDFASMEEVIRRRYSRLIKERKDMPKLIIVDGGKGQLSSAVKIMKDLGLRLPIIGIAKREEEIFVPGKPYPIILDKKSKALQLIQEIRDEAHRFAITYNKLLRKKKLFEE